MTEALPSWVEDAIDDLRLWNFHLVRIWSRLDVQPTQVERDMELHLLYVVVERLVATYERVSPVLHLPTPPEVSELSTAVRRIGAARPWWERINSDAVSSDADALQPAWAVAVSGRMLAAVQQARWPIVHPSPGSTPHV